MKRGILFIAGLVLGSGAVAQNFLPKPPRTTSLELGLQIGNPEGALENAYSGTPVGFNVNISKPLGSWSPIEVGVDMGWNTMGSKTADVPVYNEWGYAGEGDLAVRNSYQAYHAQLRFKPLNGRIKPYADVYGGAKAHQTVATLNHTHHYERDLVYRDVLERDWTESYGWGVGLQVGLSRHVNLDIRSQRMQGGESTIVDRSSVLILPDGGVSYDVLNVESTPLNITTVGITFTF